VLRSAFVWIRNDAAARRSDLVVLVPVNQEVSRVGHHVVGADDVSQANADGGLVEAQHDVAAHLP
jgi:hypothetical protein